MVGDRNTEPITIIIVTHNSEHVIPPLLESLDAGLAGVVEWELVVVDNASRDQTLAVVARRRPDAKIVTSNRNIGYGAAINLGVRSARLDGAVLVLNPDVLLHRGALRELESRLAIGATGICVPQVRDPDDKLSLSLRRDPSVRRGWAEAVLGGSRATRMGWGEIVGAADAYQNEHTVDWATGAAMLISRACRGAVGAWDESFFLYSEEVDFCQRARAAGFSVRYVPEAVIEHVGGDYGANADLWALLVSNKVMNFRRTHGRAKTEAFRAAMITGEALRGLRRPSSRTALRRVIKPAPGQAQAAPAPRQQLLDQAPGFIWFAGQDWWYHNRAHSDFQLMREVARSRSVLVVNSIGLRLPTSSVTDRPWRRIGRKLRSTSKLVRRPVQGLPRFHVMTPLIIPAYGEGVVSRFNAWSIRHQVRAVARVVGVGNQPHIGVTIPSAWPVVTRMRRTSLVYNRADLHSAFPEANGTWVEGLEQRLLRRADHVLYVSHGLQRQDRDVVGNRSVFLDHGVDVDHFRLVAPSQQPDDLLRIPQPRIGFFGGIDNYVVDIPLLVETARQLPDVSLVIIGDATCPMDELTALRNVYWLGHRPYETIPAYGSGFDVGLMPWLDNEWIRFANPIKLKEYLALGLPVASTHFPEIDYYRQYVGVADRAHFPGLVRELLSVPGDADRRRESVLPFSWANRARLLLDTADSIEVK